MDSVVYIVNAGLEWLMFRNCMFLIDSEATRNIIMLMENPPDAMLEIVKAADVTTGAAIRVFACAVEIFTSEVTL